MPESFTTPISASTRFCAVYGHPIRHSASPAMQNAGIAALGLDWRYLAFDVPPAELRQAIDGARAMRFIGLNLTVPHKLLALDFMDALDESARRWGAVNTVRFETLEPGGVWTPLGAATAEGAPGDSRPIRSHGFNTDADAITRSIREDLDLDPRGASVLILGAGGAGRTAALKLAADGAGSLFLVNRTVEKAAALMEEIQQRFPETRVSADYPETPVDLLLNATSLGLRPDDPSPMDERRFNLKNAGTVYDMIYRPAETPLILAARKAGRPASNGLGMLLHQGAAALEIWSGRKPPVETMRRTLELNVYGR